MKTGRHLLTCLQILVIPHFQFTLQCKMYTKKTKDQGGYHHPILATMYGNAHKTPLKCAYLNQNRGTSMNMF
jgi:hypothetical protein